MFYPYEKESKIRLLEGGAKLAFIATCGKITAPHREVVLNTTGEEESCLFERYGFVEIS